MIKAWFLIL